MSTCETNRFAVIAALCVFCVLSLTACTMPKALDVHRNASGKASLLADEIVVDYVSKVGGRVAKAASRPNLSFHVLDSPVANAYSTPGNRVFITRALLERMDTEAQLAGVLAHETAHCSQGMGHVMAFGSAVEDQCDAWAVQWMADSGYDPGELVVVMYILREANGEPNAFSDHSAFDIRIKNIQRLIRRKDLAKHADVVSGDVDYEQNVLQRLRPTQ